MPSTFTPTGLLEKMATGEKNNTWGGILNSNFDTIDKALFGYLNVNVAGGIDVTPTAANALNAVLDLTGVITANINLILPTLEDNFWIINNSTGDFTITAKTLAGTGVVVPQGFMSRVYCDATDILPGHKPPPLWASKAKTAAYTLRADDRGQVILCDASSAAFTVTGLAAATAGDGYTVVLKKTDTSANAVTFDPNGAELVDGATTYVLAEEDQAIILFCDGTEWRILSIYNETLPDTRNLFCNGGMKISQEVGPFTSIGAAATAYTVDEVVFHTEGSPAGRVTVTQETSEVFAGFPESIKIDCTTANGAPAATELFNGEISIEAEMLQHLKWGTADAKSLAVRFKAKFPKSGVQGVAAYQPDGDRSFIREITVTSADTEEEFFVIFPGDTSGVINNDQGEGLRIAFPLVAGSNFHATKDAWAAGEDYSTSSQQNMLDNTANNIEITGIKIEVGTRSTPHFYTHLDEELERCQRYYERSYPIGSPTGAIVLANQITDWQPVLSSSGASLNARLRKKRAIPTITWYSPNTGTKDRIRDFTTNTDETVLSTTGTGPNRTGFPTVSGSIVANVELSAHYLADARMR